MKKTLTLQILLPTLAALAFGMFVLGAALLALVGNSAYQQVKQNNELTSNFVAAVMVPYVTNYDLTALSGFANELTRNGDIVYADFLDEKGRSLISDLVKAPANKSALLMIEKDILDGTGKKIGRFVMGTRQDSIDTIKRRASIAISGGIGIVLVLVFFIISVVVRRAVRPVQEIRSVLDAVTQGNLEARTTFEAPNEVGQIAASLNIAIAALRHDLARRVQSEDLLRDQEEFFRLISENIGDFIAVHDLQGIRVYNSPSYIRFLGGEKNLVGTDSFKDVFHEDRERMQRAFKETIASGIGQRLEYRLALADGRIREMESNGAVIRDRDGKITRVVVVSRDITERKAAEIEIKNLAYYDPLTKLPNRRLLLDRLPRTLATHVRKGSAGALMFIDLDNFKMLNDTLGHEIGDLLLQQVAQRVLSCVRETDTVARLGGDEFVVMLENLKRAHGDAAHEVEEVAKKILAALNQPYKLQHHDYTSTPSIGVTLFGDHLEDMDELLKRADLAMYQAKTAGRNAIRFFDPDMQARVTARTALENDLRDGLWKNQFILYFQGQIGDDSKVFGAEVLVRWRHPVRGLIPPFEFIPLAEESGLILPLGHLILETACYQLATWATDPAMARLNLAVNVSARQFLHRDFVDLVVAVLGHTGAPSHRLKLELTESLLVDNVEEIISKMTALKTLGVKFSLDDFGTGFSSLSYLKRLPLDQLKIDQSFVRDLLTDPDDVAIARTIVALGQSLGLSVIAEGVETEEQRLCLAEQGCHAYQGYLYGRPVPVAEFEALVKS